MAQGSVLTRRLMLCSRTQAPCSISTPCRALSSSSVRPSAKVPTLSDLNSQSAPAFEAKQQQFRANLKDAKAKADRQSLEFSSTSSALSRTSRGHLNETSDEGDGLALGSLSTDDAGEAREHARNQDSTSSSSSKKKGGALQSLIYGTEEGREMDREMERSFSQVLARGKYVHSIVFHEVKPDKVEEYVDLVGGWYPKVASMPQNKVNLVGSWRTEVGDCDTFVHIWEYQRYHGYHDSLYNIQHLPEFAQFDSKLKSLIHSKKTSLMQEFSFWPTTPPRELGGLFELRSYELHPGNLLEWETHWRKGLEARREVMEGVGAWFVQVGELNTVHHLWQFADLEERKLGRERSWAVEGWSDTVHKTVPLIQTMKSRILIPMPWSPVSYINLKNFGLIRIQIKHIPPTGKMVDFKEEKYDGSKPIPLTKHVFTHPLANCPGKSQVGLVLTFPPGASFPPHTHNGAAVTAYVIKGSVYNAMNSAPVELKHAGDNWHEAPGCHHRLSMNASESEEAEFLSTLIIDTEVVEKEGVMGLTVVDEEFQDIFMKKMKESGQA